MVLLLIRSLVPRIRSYSRFAGLIAGGRSTDLLTVRGHDELTDLGNALNEMVDARDRLTSYESAQTEFIETLQATASEEEAHNLLKRHLERSLPGSGVTVLTRNNSNNRLEAATAPREGDPVTARLVGAEPRACLALRMGAHPPRGHREPAARVLGLRARRGRPLHLRAAPGQRRGDRLGPGQPRRAARPASRTAGSR